LQYVKSFYFSNAGFLAGGKQEKEPSPYALARELLFDYNSMVFQNYPETALLPLSILSPQCVYSNGISGCCTARGMSFCER
jgi:hypothetical protein